MVMGEKIDERLKERLEYVRNLYDNLADRYDEIYGEEQLGKYWTISPLIYGEVLDLGCGTGIGHVVIDPSYYVGLDISFNMAKKACARDLDVVVGEMHLLPFREDSFDVVIAITVIDVEHYRLERVISEALRVGGLFIHTIIACGEEVVQILGRAEGAFGSPP